MRMEEGKFMGGWWMGVAVRIEEKHLGGGWWI